jgi:phage antirepressor YoqD-like protein
MARAWADSRERELLAEAKSRALVQQLETEQPYIELAHSITGSSTMYVRDWIALMKEDHNVTLKEKAVREFLHEQGYWYWTQTPPRETRAYSTYDHLFKLEAELINGYPRQVLKITGDGVLVLTPIVIAHFDTKRLKSKSKT